MIRYPSQTATESQTEKPSDLGSLPNSIQTFSKLEIEKGIAQLQYNFLMKSPQLIDDSLNFKLFVGNLNSFQALFHITNVDKRGKISLHALCPNQFIQKLRILYFVILTEAYCSLKDCKEKNKKPGRYFGSSGQNSGKNNNNVNQNYCGKTSKLFQSIINNIRLKYYKSEHFSQINKKYLAEFFQFLNLDLQSFQNSQNFLISSEYQNPVITLLNKYPIIDQILIDGLLHFMSECLQKNPTSLDDNFNLKSFLNEQLNLQTEFISNWELVIEDIHIIIGVDQFFMSRKVDGYLQEIVDGLNHLDYMKEYGMDVSRVGQFDRNVFEKMELSFIFGIDGEDDHREMKHDEDSKFVSILKDQVKSNQKQNVSCNIESKFVNEADQIKEFGKQDFNIGLHGQKFQFTKQPSIKFTLVPEQSSISPSIILEDPKQKTYTPNKSNMSSSSHFAVPLNSSLSMPKLQILSKRQQVSGDMGSNTTQNKTEFWKQNESKDGKDLNKRNQSFISKINEKDSLKKQENIRKESSQLESKLERVGSFVGNKFQNMNQASNKKPQIEFNSNMQGFSGMREKRFISTPFSSNNKTSVPDSTLKLQINPSSNFSSNQRLNTANIPFQKYNNNLPLQPTTQTIPQQSSQNTQRSYTTYQKPLPPNLSFQSHHHKGNSTFQPSQSINTFNNIHRSPSYLQIGNSMKTEGQLLWEKHALSGSTKNTLFQKDFLNRNKTNHNQFQNNFHQPQTNFEFKHFSEYNNKMPNNQYSHPKPQNQNQPNPQYSFNNSGHYPTFQNKNSLNMKINLNSEYNAYPQFIKQKTVSKSERNNFGNIYGNVHNNQHFNSLKFDNPSFGNVHFTNTNLSSNKIGESKQNGVSGSQNNEYELYKRGEKNKFGFVGY